jgi:hypothetical protein
MQKNRYSESELCVVDTHALLWYLSEDKNPNFLSVKLITSFFHLDKVIFSVQESLDKRF